MVEGVSPRVQGDIKVSKPRHDIGSLIMHEQASRSCKPPGGLWCYKGLSAFLNGMSWGVSVRNSLPHENRAKSSYHLCDVHLAKTMPCGSDCGICL